jgi:hypothetical protein
VRSEKFFNGGATMPKTKKPILVYVTVNLRHGGDFGYSIHGRHLDDVLDDAKTRYPNASSII